MKSRPSRREGRRHPRVRQRDVVRSLLAHGLVDELRVWLHPFVFAGTKLFNDDSSLVELSLADGTTFGSGVILLTYQLRS